jgi:cation-transporting ATPase E
LTSTSAFPGLSAAEVAERVAQGRVNRAPRRAGRSTGQILSANVFTPFTAVLGALVAVIAVVGPPQDGLFGLVLGVNIAIGTVQEVRAKRALDRLAVLTAPVATVARDGELLPVPTDQVVADDVMLLRAGDQVVADGEVLSSSGLELDESLLSGESGPVARTVGSEVLSGSIVVAGAGYARVVCVGEEAFAQRLQAEARRTTVPYSELQRGANTILRGIGVAMVPVGALLVTSQVLRAHLHLPEALRGAVAGVSAMVPEGLVLLTTIAFAVGALRLARRRVLVQSLPAIESLARVDVLCIDKTGTITLPGMGVSSLRPLDAGSATPLAAQALGAMAGSDPAPNTTMRAIHAEFPEPAGWQLRTSVAFSSARKWSAAQFEGRGTYVLGGPDMVFADADERLAGVLGPADTGQRALVLARTEAPLEGDRLPAGLYPLAVVMLAEHVRPDAARTLAYLADQGVEVKVISGDDPATVGSIAERAGVRLAAPPCDARTLPDDPDELRDAIGRSNVFGRVTPAQKRAIVGALQADGRVVAMTGDGVNDIPALKQADIGIAMGSGSQACRAVGSIVLLDSDFAAVPRVLDEGRRVIANIERVANLFITKTAYASVLALAVGISALPYPFYPRQLTVISSLTIGIPGFFLALAPGAPRAQPHFLRRVAAFSVPAGALAAACVMAVYGVGRWAGHAGAAEVRMASAVSLFVVAVLVLAALARPFTPWRAVLVAAMAAAGVLVVAVPFTRSFFALSVPPGWLLSTTAGAGAVAATGLVASERIRAGVMRAGAIRARPSRATGTGASLPGGAAPHARRPVARRDA